MKTFLGAERGVFMEQGETEQLESKIMLEMLNNEDQNTKMSQSTKVLGVKLMLVRFYAHAKAICHWELSTGPPDNCLANMLKISFGGKAS